MIRSFARGPKRVLALLGSISVTVVLAVAVLAPSVAVGQATRTWVSGVGDDVNPCSRTAPCKTFPGAISKTATGGEINCIDPGGFGAVTITKAITIDCSDVEAGILVAGTNGITINITSGLPTDIVTLRGLDIEGVGSGLSGISILSAAAVHVDDTQIRGFRAGAAAGISMTNSANAVELDVLDSQITDNGTGTTGGGIIVQPSGSGAAKVSLTNVQLTNNVQGLRADTTGSTTNRIDAAVESSGASGNTFAGFAAVTSTTSGPCALMIDSSSSTSNGGAGVTANGVNAIARIGRTEISGNATGTLPASSGVVQSYQTNQIRGNTSDGSRTNITGE